MAATQRLGVKSAWISDLHLGSPHTRAVGMLNDFLALVAPTQLYLLGDVYDGWEMSKRPRWTQGCEEAVQRLFALPAHGTKVTQIPGNHDIGLRQWLEYAGIKKGDRENHLLLEPRNSYPTYNGTQPGIRLMQGLVFHNSEGAHLLAHGDEQEKLDPAQHRLVKAYDAVYYPLARATPAFNRLRSWRTPKPYTVLAQKFQDAVCRVMDFVGTFEGWQVAIAKDAGVQGIICGHIHYQADKMVDGIRYRNPGSMQVDQKLLVEDQNGTIHKVDWGSVCMKLAASRRAGRGVAGPLDELAEQIRAQRLTDALPFTYRNPGVDAAGQLRSTAADLLATATYGRGYRKMPVMPA